MIYLCGLEEGRCDAWAGAWNHQIPEHLWVGAKVPWRRLFVSQVAAFSLFAFQLGHLVFGFPNGVIPGNKKLR